MTTPIITRHAQGMTLVRKGRATITPPAPPGTLSAVAGDAQATLTWSASPTAGVTYQIRRVNQNAIVWSGSSLSAVIGALNNDVTYNFQVYAVNGSNMLSGPSNIATVIPKAAGDPSTPVETLYGYNWNSDTSHQTIAGRKGHFGGRVPAIRIYSPNDLTSSPPGWSNAQEGRMSTSFKAGGGFSESQLATSTAALDMMISHLENLQAGTKYYWTHHHEPNSSGGMEVPYTQFVQVYDQMMNAKSQASLAADVEVWITANFMAYQVDTSNWSDAWVPNCDILTWDIYGNPGVNTSPSGSNKYGGPATGSAYGTTYPLADQRCAPMFRVTERTGYADSWGVLEVNSPLRNWDANEAGRLAWHEDMLALFNNPPMAGAVPPKICLLWEAPSGVNWRQGYGYNNYPGTEFTAVGATVNYNATTVQNSPLWAFWDDYVESVPLP